MGGAGIQPLPYHGGESDDEGGRRVGADGVRVGQSGVGSHDLRQFVGREGVSPDGERALAHERAVGLALRIGMSLHLRL